MSKSIVVDPKEIKAKAAKAKTEQKPEKKPASKPVNKVGKANKERRDDWKRRAMIALGLTVWVGVALFVTMYVMSFILVKILTPMEALSNNTINALYQAITYVVATFVIIAVPKKLFAMKASRDELGLTGWPTWTDLLLAPIVLVAVMFVGAMITLLMKAILPSVDWEQTQQVGFSSLYQLGDFIVAFICLVVLAPIFEEVIFRGWLYGKVRALLPAFPAMLLVSVLFGIMHGQWNVGVTVFAMSLGMCLQRELTGTIWSGVVLHMIKNGIAFYFLFGGGL